MSQPVSPSPALWRLNAAELTPLLQRGDISSVELTQSVLNRVAEVNPRINALTEVMADQALAAARQADAAAAAARAGTGPQLGELHGLPVSIKINVDVTGSATTDGLPALAQQIAPTDSPAVQHLRAAGAIVIGRNNAPAFSLRWFSDNALHGRTLNPFDPSVTPGGSSGGAAAAAATGMGVMHLGSDYGGSIRNPAAACGVVGLRPTMGRIPAFKTTLVRRSLSNQFMSVQGPLTRTVGDARRFMRVLCQGSPLDPHWVPVPLDFPDTTTQPLRVALFKQHPAFEADPRVVAAVEQAGRWLREAGCEVDEVVPPHFEEASALWRHLVMADLRGKSQAQVETLGDAGVRSALQGYLDGLPHWGASEVLEGYARRMEIARDWNLFFERHPVMILPNGWARPFPIDADIGPPAVVQRLLRDQSPLLATAMLGLPGLAVPTGWVDGLPSNVQVCAWRYREDLALRAGELIERAAGFNVLNAL